MKKCKYIIFIVCILITGTLGLSGCKKTVTCEICGQTKAGDTYDIGGIDVSVCDDCYDSVDELQEDMDFLEGMTVDEN